MTAILRIALAISLAGLLSACGIRESMERADKEIAAFHTNLDRQDFDAIWKTTSGEFRKAGTKDDFSKLLEAVHRKLGPIKQVDRQGWQSNTNNGVSTVSIQTRTTFEKGEAQESFVYLWEGEQLRLLAYNINSNALIYN